MTITEDDLAAIFFFDSYVTRNPAENDSFSLSSLPTPPLGQDMTQSQFLSGVSQV